MKVLRLVAAHDVGRVINPTTAEGQIEGAALHGLGYAISEDSGLTGELPSSRTLEIISFQESSDMPKIEVIFVETNDPNGPFGAKGIAEPALVPVAPAVANAVYDATRVRVRNLPLTGEKVLNEMMRTKSR